MNELEAQKLIAKAQQYLGQEIEVEVIDDKHFGKKKKIGGIFTRTKIIIFTENKDGVIVLPFGVLTDLNDDKLWEPAPLSEIVRKFENKK